MKISSMCAVVSLLALAACGGETPDANAPVSKTPVDSATSISKQDIVDTAASAGQFKTLLAALKAADLETTVGRIGFQALETTLRGPGPFTVFAPTDDAFAKVPKDTLDSLLKPENKAKLQAILTYHVVPGKVMAVDAKKLTTAKTANGKELKLDATGGGLKVNGANVIKADIQASNGVIHVIDAVIIPE